MAIRDSLRAFVMDPARWAVSLVSDRLQIEVLFPEPSPLLARHKCLAELFCSFNTEADSVYLNHFYVYTAQSLNLNDKREVLPVTDAESRLAKGLGKAMLCFAMNLLVQAKKISRDAQISLEASGGQCSAEEIRAVLAHSTEAKLDRFLKAFPTSVADFVDSFSKEPTVWDKAEIVCDHLANQKLVSYYSTFGLNAVPVSRAKANMWSTVMTGSVRDILKVCR